MKILSLKVNPVEGIVHRLGSGNLLLSTNVTEACYELYRSLGLKKLYRILSRAFIDQNNSEIESLTEKNLNRRRIRHRRLFSNRYISCIYSWYRYAQSYVLYEYFLCMIKKSRPEYIVVWNGSLMPMSILRIAGSECKLPITYFENGFFLATLQVDNQGINGNNSVVRNPDYYKSIEINSNIVFEYNKRKQKNIKYIKQNIGSDRSYIFVPMQVPSDMQVTELSNWIKSMEQFYDVLLNITEMNHHIIFVVKEHPSFKLSIQSKVVNHPRIIFANAGVTQDLIDGAYAVLTINSTVGIEALSLGKKVITLGEACYNLPGIVQHAEDLSDLLKIINDLDHWDFDEILRKKFLTYIGETYLISGCYDDLSPETILQIKDRILKRDAHSIAINNL